jgi:hypothetical protein
LRLLEPEYKLARGMKKATSSSADASKGAKAGKTKSTKKPATKKAASGKRIEAADQSTKAPAVPSLRERIAEAKKNGGFGS